MSDENQNEAVITAPESGTTAVPDVVDNGSPGEQELPKTFTQDELDKIVGERLAKAERKWQREQVAQESQRQAPAEPPKPGQFTTAEDYAEALAEYKVERKIAEREVQQQRKQVESTYAEREEDARTKYSDFEEVAYNKNLRITPEMAEVIKASDIGPDVVYHLGSNPKEAERISRLSPLAQAREIGKIEASLASNSPAVKKASSAPEPIKPVGTRSTTPSYDPTDPRSSKMSDSDWINARNNQIAKKHRA